MRKESWKGRRQRKEERKMGRKVRGGNEGIEGVNLTKKIRIHHQISIIASFKEHISTFQSKQYTRCFSHEASLVALAPTSLLHVAQWKSIWTKEGHRFDFFWEYSNFFSESPVSLAE